MTKLSRQSSDAQNLNNLILEDHMNSLIKIAVILAFGAVASGNLPQILTQVRKAQFQLIMESKASNWPKAMTLPKEFTSF